MNKLDSKVIVEPESPTGGTMSETDIAGNQGTAFPYGDLVRFPVDEHRRTYTHEDAMAVAHMVNTSSWIAREK